MLPQWQMLYWMVPLVQSGCISGEWLPPSELLNFHDDLSGKQDLRLCSSAIKGNQSSTPTSWGLGLSSPQLSKCLAS